MVGFGTLPYKTHATESTLLYQNKMFLPKSTPTGEFLLSYYSVDTTSGAMVGENGAILKYNPDLFEFELDPASGVVTTEDLADVCFSAPDNAVAVGAACTILKWDGVSWTLSPDSGMLPNVRLQSVYDTGSFIIAAGFDNVTHESVILHKGFYIEDGAYLQHLSWTEVYRSSDIIGLWEVDAYTLYNFVCGGSSGKYVESTDWGNTWSAIKQTPAVGNIYSFSFQASDFGFGVTDLGEIIKWDGTSWKLLPSPTSLGLRSVHCFSLAFALAVADGGAIFAWDGKFWNEYPSPVGVTIWDIWGVTPNFCWICGAGGFIAQFQSQTYPSLLIDSAGNNIAGHGKVIGKVEGASNIPYDSVSETQIFEDEAIRDTNAHNSSVGDCSYFKVITIWVENGLDQKVSVQVKGNRVDSVAGAVDIGTAFDVATVDREARTIEPTGEGFLPFIFIEVTAAVIPTTDDLNAYLIKKPV